MDKLLSNTLFPDNIIFVVKKYIPYCHFCKEYYDDLHIEFSNLLQCCCDLDSKFCIHNIKYICDDCSVTCKCGGKIYKNDPRIDDIHCP